MSTDRVDIADLVAKLDALYKAATTEGTHDNGALLHDTGDETCEPDCRACDFEAALEAAWPKELRRIVVEVEEYADAADELTASFRITDSERFATASRVAQQKVTNALAKVYAAVRGEA